MKQDLIEALKQLARGNVNAAEAVADLLIPPVPEVFDVELPKGFASEAPAKKAKAK